MVIALNLDHEAFVIYIAGLNINPDGKVDPSKRGPIAFLKVDKTFTKVSSKYVDFANVFLSKLAAELSEHTKINNHTIE